MEIFVICLQRQLCVYRSRVACLAIFAFNFAFDFRWQELSIHGPLNAIKCIEQFPKYSSKWYRERIKIVEAVAPKVKTTNKIFHIKFGFREILP